MKLSLLIERIYPYICGVVSAVAFHLLPIAKKAELIPQVSPQTLTLVSIITAFVATSMTIALTASDHRSVQQLRSIPEHFANLIRYHTESVRAGIVAAILAIVVLVIAKSLDNIAYALLADAWVFFVVSTILTFYRVVNIMQKLLL